MLDVLLFAVIAQAAPPPSADFDQLDTFLTFTRTPSGLVVETEVRIGTFTDERFGPDRTRPTNYWFDRTVRAAGQPERLGERSYTNTDACPGARQALFALEDVTMPHPDVQDHGREPRFSTVDGVHYELTGTSLHSDGQNGLFTIESNSGSPAARWVDRMLSALDHCWRPRP